MRRILILLGLLVLLWISWRQVDDVAPGDGDADTAAVLHRGNGAEPETLDPQIARSDSSGAILRDLYEGLTRLGPDGQVIAGAASSWDVSADGRTYTFHLRSEARWSNGDPLTAHDYVFSMRRLVDPETAAAFAFFLSPLVNAPEIIAGDRPAADLAVIALDEHTLEIRLRAPTPYLPGVLTHPANFPVHRPSLSRHGRAFTRPGNLVSNGAYVLSGAVTGSHYSLEKNRKYWDAENTAIAKVVYHQIVNQNAELARFRAGELDITYTVPNNQFALAAENYPDQLKVSPQLTTYYYGFNLRRAPFAGQRGLRRALSMVVDRRLLAGSILTAGQEPAYGWVPPGVANYTAIEPEWAGWTMAQRLAEARRLYRAAGYSAARPLKIEIRYNSADIHRNIAVAIASIWNETLGVQASQLNVEFQVLLQDMRNGNADVFRSSWIADYDDAYTFLEILRTGAAANFVGYANPDYDDFLGQAAATPDADRRRVLLQQAEAVMLEDQPLMPIYFYVNKRMVGSRVEGWQSNSLNIHYSQDLSLAGPDAAD
ncbi:MAG: peptide ABC transporter substrate-binding protein [Gammaproteobacteria bacterium]